MKLSKKLLIIISVVILASGFLIYSKNKSTSDTRQTAEIEKRAEVTNNIVVPKNLTQCTNDLLAQDCDIVATKTVCGYDHTTYESGKEKDNTLEFKSACHYCRFYGLEEKDIAGTRIKGLGFEEKPCNQGMYKNK